MKKGLAAVFSWFVVAGLPGMGWAIDYRLEASLARYHWTEDVGSVQPEEKNGPMYELGGYVVGSPFASRPELTLRGELQVFHASVDYDTFLLGSPQTAVDTQTVYWGAKHELDLGVRVKGGRTTVEPFMGLAYRWWQRYIKSTDSVTGYPEWYRTLYGRLGLRGEHWFSRRVALITTASVDPMLWARERIDLGDISGEILTVRNGKRSGWTLEIGVQQLAPDGRHEVDASLFWQATRFGESNVVACGLGGSGGCLQPESDQNIIGLKIGVKL